MEISVLVIMLNIQHDAHVAIIKVILIFALTDNFDITIEIIDTSRIGRSIVEERLFLPLAFVSANYPTRISCCGISLAQ